MRMRNSNMPLQVATGMRKSDIRKSDMPLQVATGMRKSDIRKSDMRKSDMRKSDMPLEVVTDIINNTSNIQDAIANYGLDTLLLPCLKFIKNGATDEISLATKAIGLLAIKTARDENAYELLRKTTSTFSNIKSEDVTEKVLECLAITTLAGATHFSEIEKSMKIIWRFICSFSKSKLKANKNWASVMAKAISVWSLLLTTMNTEGLVILSCFWNGVMIRIMDMLEEENCIQIACVEALAIICEKKCFQPFSSEEHHDHWNIQEWEDEVREQVTTTCGWKSEFSKFFEVDGVSKISKNIFECEITLKSWSQLRKIDFIDEFFGEDFTVQLMEIKFIRHLFELGPNVQSFGPILYEPVYEEVEEKGNLQNVRNLGGRHRKMVISSVTKGRSILLGQKRTAKAEMLSNLSIC